MVDRYNTVQNIDAVSTLQSTDCIKYGIIYKPLIFLKSTQKSVSI